MKVQHVSSGTVLIIRSSKLYLQPLVYMPIRWPAVVKAEWEKMFFPTQPWQRPVTTWAYKPEAANTVYSSWWWAVCRSKHVEHSKNFGIINSITKLHVVGISTEYGNWLTSCISTEYGNWLTSCISTEYGTWLTSCISTEYGNWLTSCISTEYGYWLTSCISTEYGNWLTSCISTEYGNWLTSCISIEYGNWLTSCISTEYGNWLTSCIWR